MPKLHRAKGGIPGVLTLLLVLCAPFVTALDFDRGNAALTVVIPRFVPTLREFSPGDSDAPVIMRITALMNNAWFDAIAPYHPTAVGIYSKLGRRPAAEAATNRNKNIAILYASYRALNSLLPNHRDDWRQMLMQVGLDPDDASTDTTTAVGIGNVAGAALMAAREHDGMNQLGDEGGQVYNRRMYLDYTGYEPVNPPSRIVDPTRWQPLLLSKPSGPITVQTFRTPQWALTKAYTYDDPSVFRVPPPTKSDPRNVVDYQQQADEVLALSAALDDYHKAVVELIDDKIRSLGTASVQMAVRRKFTLDEFVQNDFMWHVAVFDAGIACWQEKARYDAVRPNTAIHHLYAGRTVTAWGGPGKGRVTDLPGTDWRPYLNQADHPEYPSGSACFCAAFAQAQRRFTGSDDFGFSVLVPKGSSLIEPGITPARNVTLRWKTFTDFASDCAMARVWGGTHFVSAIEASKELCRPMGDMAYEFVKKHIDGTAP
jgi:hypothetical protein